LGQNFSSGTSTILRAVFSEEMSTESFHILQRRLNLYDASLPLLLSVLSWSDILLTDAWYPGKS
jgi:hypothetical protein